jgi:CRP/FNR family transcriptional regulator, cyclic AMP receptor protein
VTDHTSLLGSLNLFESLSTEELAGLSARLEEVQFPAGKVIFEQGAPGGRLFIIEEGAVDISYGTGKTALGLATLVPGEYFGELSLFDGEPRSATARAARDCKLLALDHDDFVAFTSKRPDAALKIMRELARRLRHTNAAFSSQVSRNVLKEEAEQLTFGQRVADKVASFGGSWTFIGSFGAAMAVWMIVNSLLNEAFDPFPFILLNLMLSTLAALQAPVIMMSQNRQGVKEKLLAENDYQVNLKSELGIQALLKGQAELIARVGLLERQVTPSRRPGALSIPTEGT